MAKIKVLKGEIDIANSLVENDSEVDVKRDGEFFRTHITTADYEDDFQIVLEIVAIRDIVWDAYEFVKDTWPDIGAPETWRRISKKLGELGSDIWRTVKEARIENFLFELISVNYETKNEKKETDAFVISDAVFSGKIKMPSSGGVPIATINGDVDCMIAGMPGNGYLFPKDPSQVETSIVGRALAGTELFGDDFFSHLITASIAIDVPSLIARLRENFGNEDYTFEDFSKLWDIIFDDENARVEIKVQKAIYKISIDEDIERARRRYLVLQQNAEAEKANHLVQQKAFRTRIRELLEEGREQELRDRKMKNFMEEQLNREEQWKNDLREFFKSSIDEIGLAPISEFEKAVSDAQGDISKARTLLGSRLTTPQLRIIAIMNPTHFVLPSEITGLDKKMLLDSFRF
ncbi:hypothetical protein IFO69_19085 [Echinicola sp. CAU 1574]|uniref:Uncharacterized protein n=1 Tax=Echinicola arenosa TaxID=2774144 RepID=A0ABR9ASI2_9BACT|nr:hypothetical protein [Echinicola arenosa]MBD8490865.1 hypothetical protein [Echinicola arenosa]